MAPSGSESDTRLAAGPGGIPNSCGTSQVLGVHNTSRIAGYFVVVPGAMQQGSKGGAQSDLSSSMHIGTPIATMHKLRHNGSTIM